MDPEAEVSTAGGHDHEHEHHHSHEEGHSHDNCSQDAGGVVPGDADMGHEHAAASEKKKVSPIGSSSENAVALEIPSPPPLTPRTPPSGGFGSGAKRSPNSSPKPANYGAEDKSPGLVHLPPPPNAEIDTSPGTTSVKGAANKFQKNIAEHTSKQMSLDDMKKRNKEMAEKKKRDAELAALGLKPEGSEPAVSPMSMGSAESAETGASPLADNGKALEGSFEAVAGSDAAALGDTKAASQRSPEKPPRQASISKLDAGAGEGAAKPASAASTGCQCVLS